MEVVEASKEVVEASMKAAEGSMATSIYFKKENKIVSDPAHTCMRSRDDDHGGSKTSWSGRQIELKVSLPRNKGYRLDQRVYDITLL